MAVSVDMSQTKMKKSDIYLKVDIYPQCCLLSGTSEDKNQEYFNIKQKNKKCWTFKTHLLQKH